MKKLVAFLMVLTLGLGFNSCSKDDDNSASIVGSWEFSQQGTIVNGQELLTAYENDCDSKKDYIEIKNDGTAVGHYFDFDCLEETANSSWSKDGNILTITEDGETSTTEILDLTSTTLKTKGTETYNGTEYVYITVLIRK